MQTNVTCLADEGIRMDKRFTGAMVGMCDLNCMSSLDGMAYRANEA